MNENTDQTEIAEVSGQLRAIDAELVVLRKGVEALFEHLDKVHQPIDYSADLGRLVQGFGGVMERLHAIEKAPGVKTSGADIADIIRTAATGAGAAEHRAVGEAARALHSARCDIDTIIGQARSQSEQKKAIRRTLYWAGGLGALAILVLTVVLPPRVTLGPYNLFRPATYWGIAWAMLRDSDPALLVEVHNGWLILDHNRTAVAECKAAVAQSGRAQNCTLVINPP